MYNGNENIVICEHPLIKHKITMLRNKETGTNEFRAIVEEIAMLMGYEALMWMLRLRLRQQVVR